MSTRLSMCDADIFKSITRQIQMSHNVYNKQILINEQLNWLKSNQAYWILWKMRLPTSFEICSVQKNTSAGGSISNGKEPKSGLAKISTLS